MKLRVPSALRQQIERAAKASNRTMNAEIVSRLEFTFAVDVTVQDSGFDVGYGIDSPEMKAALLKQRFGGQSKGVELLYTRAEAKTEFSALRSEVEILKGRLRALETKMPK